MFYQQGDPADEVLYLQSGQVRVECVHSDGKKRVLYLLFDGIVVGEDECIYGGVREFRAVAASECRIFRIPAEVFKRRVEASPALALKLFQVSARKSQVLSRVLVRDSFLSVQGRVIQFLLSLAERNGVQEEEGIRLTIRLTHQEAARLPGHLPGGGVPVLSDSGQSGAAAQAGALLYPARPARRWRPNWSEAS